MYEMAPTLGVWGPIENTSWILNEMAPWVLSRMQLRYPSVRLDSRQKIIHLFDWSALLCQGRICCELFLNLLGCDQFAR